MSTYATDFSEYTTGQEPSDWTRLSAPYQGDEVWAVADSASQIGGKVLRGSESSNLTPGHHVLVWDTPGIGENTEALVKFKTPDFSAVAGIDEQQHIFLRLQENALTYYAVQVREGSWQLFRVINGTYSLISAGWATPASNTWYWVRFRVNGTRLQVKTWANGSLEPTPWAVTVTDTSITLPGSVGLGFWEHSQTKDFDFISVGTAGDHAPYPVQFGHAFLKLVSNPASDMINAGTPVPNISYNGAAPDLGYWEDGDSAPVPPASTLPTVTGTTYYVSTSGSDAASGTEASPFRTIQHAVSSVSAGDGIYVRGGIYSELVTISIDGTSGSKILLRNYPGEDVVIDGTAFSGANYCLKLSGANYWHIFGIEIANSPSHGIVMNGTSSNNVLEYIRIHDSGRSDTQGSGIHITNDSSNNLFLNCDSYHNIDTTLGNADGFAMKSGTAVGNVFDGCRAYNNSDDGWDFWNGAPATLRRCYAWDNGYDYNGASLGDGNGFKLGQGAGGHLVHNCAAWDNKYRGFNRNGATGPNTLYNNTAWRQVNANYEARSQDNSILKNNISFQGGVADILDTANDTYNSWNNPPGVTVTTADFESFDDLLIRGPRNSDGSLVITPASGMTATSESVLTTGGTLTPANPAIVSLAAADTQTLSTSGTLTGAATSISLSADDTSALTSSGSLSPNNAVSLPSEVSLWESNMITYGQQWGSYLQSSNDLNTTYYDAEYVFFQIRDYTGNTSPWLTYAEKAESVYHDSYCVGNGFAIPGYWRFSHGILEDYTRNSGTDLTISSVRNIRDNPSYSDPDTNGFVGNWYHARVSREIAYAIHSQVNAEKAGESRNTTKLTLYLAMAKNHISQWRNQDWSDVNIGTTAYDDMRPFMIGLTSHALINFYEWEVANSRDPNALYSNLQNELEDLLNWLYTTATVRNGADIGKKMWVPDIGGSSGAWNDSGGTGHGAFRYSDKDTVNTSTTPAPDLNLLIATAYAWLYKQTGTAAYRTMADNIFIGGVRHAALTAAAGKIFMQCYRWSFDYITYRTAGDQSVSPSGTPLSSSVYSALAHTATLSVTISTTSGTLAEAGSILSASGTLSGQDNISGTGSGLLQTSGTLTTSPGGIWFEVAGTVTVWTEE